MAAPDRLTPITRRSGRERSPASTTWALRTVAGAGGRPRGAGGGLGDSSAPPLRSLPGAALGAVEARLPLGPPARPLADPPRLDRRRRLPERHVGRRVREVAPRPARGAASPAASGPSPGAALPGDAAPRGARPPGPARPGPTPGGSTFRVLGRRRRWCGRPPRARCRPPPALGGDGRRPTGAGRPALAPRPGPEWAGLGPGGPPARPRPRSTGGPPRPGAGPARAGRCRRRPARRRGRRRARPPSRPGATAGARRSGPGPSRGGWAGRGRPPRAGPPRAGAPAPARPEQPPRVGRRPRAPPRAAQRRQERRQPAVRLVAPAPVCRGHPPPGHGRATAQATDGPAQVVLRPLVRSVLTRRPARLRPLTRARSGVARAGSARNGPGLWPQSSLRAGPGRCGRAAPGTPRRARAARLPAAGASLTQDHRSVARPRRRGAPGRRRSDWPGRPSLSAPALPGRFRRGAGGLLPGGGEPSEQMPPPRQTRERRSTGVHRPPEPEARRGSRPSPASCRVRASGLSR
jgi:hypothetical protein